MAEWSNAAVLKTVDRLRGPGVRIPLSPPEHLKTITRAPRGLFNLRLQSRQKLAFVRDCGLKLIAP